MRPGYIEGDRGPGYKPPDYVAKAVATVQRDELVAACLKQCFEGIEMDPIGNDDLKRIGKEALSRYG